MVGIVREQYTHPALPRPPRWPGVAEFSSLSPRRYHPAIHLARKPASDYLALSLLFIQPLDFVSILGIDIGGSGMKAAPVDTTTGELLAERFRLDTPRPATPKAVARVLTQLVEHFDWDGPLGVAMPARVKRGVLQTAANIDKAWIGTNAAKLFRKKTGCPTIVLNDADAAGVAEMAFGAGRGRTDVVLMLTFGTGIGSALFHRGRLVPNTELGHLEFRGGEAEHYAADSARKREELSWEKWAKRVQKFLDHIEFILDPDLIILGGGVSRPQKRALYFSHLKTQADLLPAELQNEAGIVGAAYAVKKLGPKADP